MNLSENNMISITDLSAELRVHAEKCADAIGNAGTREEHIRATQVALEAQRLSLQLERFISQNTEVGTGPVRILPFAG